MAVRFQRIAESGIDPTRVTLRVFAGPGGTVFGRVSTLAYGETGAIEQMTTEGADPPITTALQIATELAVFKEQDVDVVDAEGLWQEAWGELR